MQSIAGSALSTFTLIHIALSLVGIFTGLVVFWGLLTGRKLNSLTAVFLATTAATSLTGFCYFPFLGFTPGQAFGILSMVLLAFAVYGRNIRSLSGVWGRVYVATAIAALYLNVFVLIVQMFQKVPALRALAPTGSEPPFFIAQGIVFVIFLGLGIRATLKATTT
jgi:hypothetical protein